MLLYSLDPECVLAAALSAQLGQPIARHEERRFEDAECKLRPLSDPRGEDAYVLLGLHGGPVDSPHDKLCRLLMFIATLREHGASRVTALLPYLAYARKDQRTKPFDPVGLRYVAQMFEAVGTDQVIALEVHNVAAFQNAFRCTTLHLDAHSAFDPMLESLVDGPLAVASPDPGGCQACAAVARGAPGTPGRCGGLRHGRQAAQRRSGHERESGRWRRGRSHGVADRRSDRKRRDAAPGRGGLARKGGALRVLAFAAHGLFTGNAAEKLADTTIDGVVVTDSVPPWRLRAAGAARARLPVASAAPLFADAIRDTHRAWQRRSCSDDADAAGPTRRNP